MANAYDVNEKKSIFLNLPFKASSSSYSKGGFIFIRFKLFYYFEVRILSNHIVERALSSCIVFHIGYIIIFCSKFDN